MGLFDNYIEQYGYSQQPKPGEKKYEQDQFLRWHEYEWQQLEAPATGYGWVEMGAPFYEKRGDGSGRYWLPGEQAQKQQELDMLQQHYYISDSISKLTEDRSKMEGEWANAVAQGNLALARDVESRMAANQAQSVALQQQQLSLDSALGQAQVGANVYGTQTQGRSSLASTMAQATKDASDAAANPFNPGGYLDLNVAAGGATPFSNATPAQNTTYGNAMAQAYQSKWGNLSDILNQAMAQTYQTPDAITAAMQQTQPWYMGTTNYQAANPNQQAIFRGLQPGQQTALAGATPEQMAALARMGQPAVNPALARYQTSTTGEKKALAGATPEQLRILWERGQVA